MVWTVIMMAAWSVAALAVAGPLVLALAWLVWASADIGSGVWLRALCGAGTDERVAALTFDDGPHPEHTPALLDTLARHGVRAAFFVVGSRAAAHPELVRRMIAEGHIVGNHTFDHSPWFPMMSRHRMETEIAAADAAIEAAGRAENGAADGSEEWRRLALFRPPFGVTNPTLARALKRIRNGNTTVVGWSIRSFDTVGAGTKATRDRIARRVERRLHPGAVILLHDNRRGADALTEEILARLEKNNYRVDRLDEMFGL